MRLASQNNIQRLFYSADKKHSFNDVLKEVQTFISNNYSWAIKRERMIYPKFYPRKLIS